MRGRRSAAVAIAMAAVMLGLVGAAPAAKAPSISVTLTPDFVGCRDGQLPAQVKVSWRIIHDVSKATLTGAVDDVGGPLPPTSLSMKTGKHGVVGSKKVHVLCSATTQVLTLTAVGKGGTTTATASLNENHSD